MRWRRGQALVEVLALAPLVAACAIGYGACATQLAAIARAEAALANAIAADAAGTSIRGAVHGRARLVAVSARTIEIVVPAPLGDVARRGQRVR